MLLGVVYLYCSYYYEQFLQSLALLHTVSSQNLQILKVSGRQTTNKNCYSTDSLAMLKHKSTWASQQQWCKRRSDTKFYDKWIYYISISFQYTRQVIASSLIRNCNHTYGAIMSSFFANLFRQSSDSPCIKQFKIPVPDVTKNSSNDEIQSGTSISMNSLWILRVWPLTYNGRYTAWAITTAI